MYSTWSCQYGQVVSIDYDEKERKKKRIEELEIAEEGLKGMRTWYDMWNLKGMIWESGMVEFKSLVFIKMSS